MATWTCPDCDTVNGADDAHCRVCTTRREEAEQRRAAEAAAALAAAREEATAAEPASRGLARRRAPALALLALVAGAVAVAVATAGSGDGHGAAPGGSPPAAVDDGSSGAGDGTSGAADAGATASADATVPVTYHRGAYSLALPASWVPAQDGVSHPGYVESRWHPAGHARVTVLVDHTAGSSADAETAARDVRAQVVGAPTYRPIAWGPATLGGLPAWRWDFDLDGLRKVDWFVHACDTGYALLGSAPPGAFDRYEPTFAQIADSLRPACA